MDHEIRNRPSFAAAEIDLNLKRSLLGGESFFRNTFTADRPGSVTLAPPLPGDVVQYDLDGTVSLQSGSYLAATPWIDVDAQFGGGGGGGRGGNI